jgi:dienelactone hydrolase
VELRPGRPHALVDTADGVVVTGAPPRARVVIEAQLELGGQAWTCTGEYAADQDGTVDTARDPSSGGTYLGVDPFGLFWSADLAAPLERSLLRPMRVTVRASCDEQTAQAAYTRALVGQGVTESDVRDQGVVGRLFVPDAAGDAPAAVLLAGSGGGPGDPFTGALLAGHGVAALCLAHWNFPGLPDDMHEIAVETVGTACDWLRAQPGVRDAAPTVIGSSRGGELALLAGALLPERVGDVVSQVGSALPWGAFGADVDVNDPAWLFGGEPVPKIHEDPDDSLAALDDPEQVAAAEIAIEKAPGRVLLLSGEDDRMWPSARLSEYAAERARRLDVADRVEHVTYPDAGHLACVPPGFPTVTEIVHPVDGSFSLFGGTRSGNQAARRDAWRRLLELTGARR